MSPADFREVLRLLDCALELFQRRHRGDPAALQRELQTLSLELDLLRARLGQPNASSERN